MTSITFLGTGNYLASGRYWNSFVIDGTLLVEPSPTALPHLRRVGLAVADLDAVFVSHFHADHTFGWPFLLLELLYTRGRRALPVVGPPGIQAHLADMMRVAGVSDVHEHAHANLDIRYIEVDGSWQDAGGHRFRAVEVEHVPHLDCYGYLFDRGGRTVGYSGDTRLCAGLEELAEASECLVLECNGRHPWPSHMDIGSVKVLRDRHPDVKYLLTHLGGDVTAADVPGFDLPDDFETVEV